MGMITDKLLALHKSLDKLAADLLGTAAWIEARGEVPGKFETQERFLAYLDASVVAIADYMRAVVFSRHETVRCTFQGRTFKVHPEMSNFKILEELRQTLRG